MALNSIYCVHDEKQGTKPSSDLPSPLPLYIGEMYVQMSCQTLKLPMPQVCRRHLLNIEVFVFSSALSGKLRHIRVLGIIEVIYDE